MTGQERPAVFHRGLPFHRGFEQVAEDAEHGEQRGGGKVGQPSHVFDLRSADDSVGERPQKPADRAFAGLSRADRRRQLAPAPGATGEIGGGIRDPHEPEHEQHLQRR